MSTRARINDLADVLDTELVLLEGGYDDAILGVLEDGSAVVYDRMEIIRILTVRDGMDREEAEEFFSFNIADPCTEGWPVFVDRRYAE